MKRLFLLITIGAALCMASCVDENYDLTKLDTSNTALGGDESEFLMPLLTMKFSAGSFSQESGDGTSSISQLSDNINVWLPSKLPGNVDYVDIQALGNDPEYRTSLLENLFAEMTDDAAKRSAVCTHIIDLYLEELVDALAESSNMALKLATSQIDKLSDQDKVVLLGEVFLAFPDDIEGILEDISNNDLIDTSIDDIYADMPMVDISEDIRMMLSENLDPSSEPNPINALYLFGKVNSNFPFKLQIHPRVEQTQIDLGEITIDNAPTDIKQTRIYQEDLQTLFNGAQLIMPIKIERYYPNMKLDDNSQISISISLRKTGGLKI